MQIKSLKYAADTATRNPYIRESVIKSAIEGLLDNRFHCYLGDSGEVIVHDPHHVQVGLNPDHGCRAVVSSHSNTCSCEIHQFLGGFCVHTAVAFIWANKEAKHDRVPLAA